MTHHQPGCGATCQCGYEQPPCRTCTCGAETRERTTEIAQDMITRWRDTLDWLATR